MSTLRCVGWPSSSTLSEPRRLPMVPSSITVHSALATFWPMRPLKAETPLRLKSASSPWPTASCSRMPGQPGPSTTVISPAGASTASSMAMASRAASAAKCSGVFSFRKKSSSTRPPPPAWPRCGGPPFCRASAETLRRASGWRSTREHAVAGRDHHLAQIVGVDRLHLEDARIVGARRAVGALHQFHALGEGRLGGRGQHRIEIVPRPSLRSNFSTLAGPAAMHAATRAALRIFSGDRSSL